MIQVRFECLVWAIPRRAVANSLEIGNFKSNFSIFIFPILNCAKNPQWESHNFPVHPPRMDLGSSFPNRLPNSNCSSDYSWPGAFMPMWTNLKQFKAVCFRELFSAFGAVPCGFPSDFAWFQQVDNSPFWLSQLAAIRAYWNFSNSSLSLVWVVQKISWSFSLVR